MSDDKRLDAGDYPVSLEGGGEQGVLIVRDSFGREGHKGFYLRRDMGPLLLKPLGNGRFVENEQGSAGGKDRVWVLDKRRPDGAGGAPG